MNSRLEISKGKLTFPFSRMCFNAPWLVSSWSWTIHVFLNDVNAIRVVIDHCPWSIRVYRYMDVVTGNLFCFVQIACGSKNVFTLWNYFGGSKWKLRRNLAEAIYKDEEIEKRGQQEFCLKCKKSSKQSSIVCHRLRETRSLRLFCCQQVSTLKKNFEETVYK